MANETSIDELLGNVHTRQAATQRKEPSALPRWSSMVVQERWNQHYSPSPWAVDTNEYVRHFKGTTFIAIGAIARKVAQQEAKVFRRIRRKSGVVKEPVDPTHPLYTLFDQVNPVHTQYDLWYQMIAWRLLTGNSYWWKARNAFGEIKELWPLPSQWVWAIPSSTQFISEYLVRGVFGGGNTYIPSKDILHVREHSIDWNGPGRYYGTPLATAGATAIDLEEAMLTRLYWQFKNFHPPGLHYTTDEKLTDDQFNDTLIQLRMQQQTAEQSGMPILSHSGVKIDDSTQTVREMDYNRSLQMIMNYLLALFGTPQAVVGVSKDYNRANMVGALLSWAENTINPLLVHTGQHLTQGIGKEFGEDIVIAFDPIEVADSDGLRSDVNAAQAAGAITPNEVREVLLKKPPFKKGGNRVIFQGAEMDWGNIEEASDDGNEAIAPASATALDADVADPAINGDVIAGNHVTPSEAAQSPQSPTDGTLHAPPPGSTDKVDPNDIESMIADDSEPTPPGSPKRTSAKEWAGEDIDDDVIASLDSDDEDDEDKQVAAFRKLLKSETRDTSGLSIRQIERMTQWLALHGREESRVANAVADFLGDQKRRILEALNSRTDLHPTDAMSLIDWQKEDAALHALMVNLLTDTRKAGINAMARRMAGRSRSQAATQKRSLRKSLDFLLKLPELADALARQALGSSLSAPYWSLVNATTLKGLFQTIVTGIADQLSLPEIAKKIMGDSGGFFGRVRAKAIARTEVSSSLNAAQMSVIEEVNASPDMYPVAMEWLAIDDKDVREAHWSANGQIIVPGVAGMDQFTLKDSKGIEQCHFPAEGTLSARNRINCRCAVVEVFPEELPEGHPIRVKLEEIYSKGNLAVIEKRATTVDSLPSFHVRLPAAIDPAFADVRKLASDDAIASHRLLKIAPRRRTLTAEDLSNVGERAAAFLDSPPQSSNHYSNLFASLAGQSTPDGGKFEIQPSGSLSVSADDVVTYVASPDGKILNRRYIPETWAEGTVPPAADPGSPDSNVSKSLYEVELTTWGLSAHLVRKFAMEDALALGRELSESRGNVLVKAEIRRQVTRLPDTATLAKRYADLSGKPARVGEFAVSPCGHLVAKCGDVTVYVASADGRVLDSEFVPAELLKLDPSPVDLATVQLDPATIPDHRPERLVIPDKVAAEGAALWRRRCRLHDTLLSHLAKMADASARNDENSERDVAIIREKIDAVRPALANLDAKVDAWTSRTGIKASEAYYAVAGQTWDGSTIRSLTTPITESRQRQRDQRERALDDDSTRPVAVTCPVSPSKFDEDIVKKAAASWLRCALSNGLRTTWQEDWTTGDILRAFKLLRGDIPAGDSPGYLATMRTLTQLPANTVLTAEGWRAAGLPAVATLDDESLLSMVADAATREQILAHIPERVSGMGPNCWHAKDGISPKATYAMAIQKCPIDVLDETLKYIAQDLLASQNAGFSDGATLTPDIELWENGQLRLLVDELSKQARRLPPATKWDRESHKFVLDVDGVFDAARVAFWRYTNDYETFKVGFAKDWCEGGDVSRAVAADALRDQGDNSQRLFHVDSMSATPYSYDRERCREHARMLLSESQFYFLNSSPADPTTTISVSTAVPGEVIAYAPSPVESWTCDRHTLKRLASEADESTILRATIPVSGILFSWESMAGNPGWWSESSRNFKREVVVLGGSVSRVIADTSSSLAKFEESKIHRDDSGKFSSGGGKGTGAKHTSAGAKKPSEPSKATPKASSKSPPKLKPSERKPRVAEKDRSLVDVLSSGDAKYGSVKKEIQRYCEERNEPMVSRGMGAKWIEGNLPVDAELTTGGRLYGIEIKTIIKNNLGKISMKKSAAEKKRKWVEANADRKARIDMVVIDDSQVYNANGEGKHDESKRAVYYRRGFGAYAIKSMHRCKNLAEARRLMTTKDDKLPELARA